MANTSNTNKKKTVANKNTAVKPVVEIAQETDVISTTVSVESTVELGVDANAPVVEASAPKATVAELPRDLYVPCVSMVRSGRLIYASKRQMGYSVIWRNYMDTQYIELAELMAMPESPSWS